MTLDLIKSFVHTANNSDCDFPLNNLPFGVCYEKNKQKCFSATTIGDQVLNLTYAEELDLIPDLGFKNVFNLGGFSDWVAAGGEIEVINNI